MSANTNSSGAQGQQLCADFHGCRAALDDEEFVKALALEAAQLAKVTVLHEHTHQFSPHGLSTVLVLAESHLAIHTWPEHGFLSLDLFSCADHLPCGEVIELFQARLESETTSSRVLQRGDLNMRGSVHIQETPQETH